MEYLIGFLCGGVVGYVATKVVERIQLDRQRLKEHKAWMRQMERLNSAKNTRKEEKK